MIVLIGVRYTPGYLREIHCLLGSSLKQKPSTLSNHVPQRVRVPISRVVGARCVGAW
jgi:hypothetical protein